MAINKKKLIKEKPKGESRKELDIKVFCSKSTVNQLTLFVKAFFDDIKIGKRRYQSGAKARLAFRNEFKDLLRELTSAG